MNQPSVYWSNKIKKKHNLGDRNCQKFIALNFKSEHSKEIKLYLGSTLRARHKS